MLYTFKEKKYGLYKKQFSCGNMIASNLERRFNFFLILEWKGCNEKDMYLRGKYLILVKYDRIKFADVTSNQSNYLVIPEVKQRCCQVSAVGLAKKLFV